MNYTASWPKEVKYISLFCIFALTGAFVLVLWLYMTVPMQGITTLAVLLPTAIVPLTILLTAIYAPTGYVLHSEGVVLKRAWRPLHLSFTETASVKVLPKRGLFSMMKLFASGGMFGYFGYFRDKEGMLFAMFTDRSNLIELKMKNGKRYFISPDNRDQFMEDLTKAAPDLVK